MKKMSVVFLVILSGKIWAQPLEIGPEAPILGKGTFGINGMAVLDVSSPVEYSYNPAVLPLALRFSQEDGYLEADYGILDFSAGPCVHNEWLFGLFGVGKNGALRIAYYGIDSNSKPIRYLGEPLVGFEGSTYELCYGRALSDNLFAGLALIPQEKIQTRLSGEEGVLVRGEAESKLHFRAGLLYVPDENLSLGVVATTDRIDSSVSLYPAVTGLPTTVRLKDDYSEQLWTFGATWQPRSGTILSGAWQKGKVKGPGIVDDDVDIWALTIRQFINPHFYISVGDYDGAFGLELGYFGNGWNIGTSFSNNNLRRTERYLGTADTWYIWIGKSW